MKKLLLIVIACVALGAQARANICGSSTPVNYVPGVCNPDGSCTVGYSAANFQVNCGPTTADMACGWKDIPSTNVAITLYYGHCVCPVSCYCTTDSTQNTVWTYTQEAYKTCPSGS